MSEQPAREVFRTARESIDVLSPPVADVVSRAHTIRRKQRRVAIGSTVVAVLAVAGLAWVTTRPPDQEPPKPTPAHVVLTPNPADIAWYAGGLLHLARVAVELPQLTDLVAVDGGAVYGDLAGTVAHVAADGTHTVIGEKVAAAPLVGSDQSDWAAWVDPRGEVPELVVFDIAANLTLDRLPLPVPAGGRQTLDVTSYPIAIDQEHILFTTAEGDFSWTPPDDEAVRLERTGLLDTASTTRVYQAGEQIDVVQTVFNVSYRLRGEGATLSPGGTAVLSRVPGEWTPGAPYRPLLYDARDGARLLTGVASDEVALDASFGGDQDVVFIVGRADDQGPEAARYPLFTLRSCQVGSTDCHDVLVLPRAGERPLLAH